MNEQNDAGNGWADSSTGRPHAPDAVDLLIDRALASYTAGEPRPALAAEILASAAARTPRRQPRPRFAWTVAASGWAVAAATVLLWLHAPLLTRGNSLRSGSVEAGSVEIAQSNPMPVVSASANPLPQPELLHARAAARTLPRPAARIPHEQTAPAALLKPIVLAPIVLTPIRMGEVN